MQFSSLLEFSIDLCARSRWGPYTSMPGPVIHQTASGGKKMLRIVRNVRSRSVRIIVHDETILKREERQDRIQTCDELIFLLGRYFRIATM